MQQKTIPVDKYTFKGNEIDTFKGYKIDTFKRYKIHTFKGYKILTLKGYKIDEIRQDEGISQCWLTCLYHLRSTCCLEA